MQEVNRIWLLKTGKRLIPAASAAVVIGVSLTACGPRTRAPAFGFGPAASSSPAGMPPLGPAMQVADGVVMHEIQLPSPRGSSKIRIFLPAKQPHGKLSCVFVAPAGTPLIYGNTLGTFGEGDEKEQIPYAQAGFAVVAYSIDGDVQDTNNENQIVQGMREFKAANGGTDNTKEAVDYALARIPNIDPARLYTAGHSSAGTLSFQAARTDSRIAACIAYAPATDIEARFGGKLSLLDGAVPGFSEFLRSISPINNADKLRCPVFLFHADDDGNVPTSDNARFADALRRSNPKVTFARVPSGNHYDSMVRQGIPKAIEWLKAMPQ